MKRDSHYRIARAQWERIYLEDAMRGAKWSVPVAADTTGIGRTQMYRLLQRHRIIPPPVPRKEDPQP